MNESNGSPNPSPSPSPSPNGAGEERTAPSQIRPQEPHRPIYRVEDERSYYMDPAGEFGPRRETHARPKRWYNQRWVLVLAMMIGVFAIVFALTGLAQEVTGVNESIREQTAAIEEQTDALAGIGQAVEDLTKAVNVGFERLIAEIRAAAAWIGGGGSGNGGGSA